MKLEPWYKWTRGITYEEEEEENLSGWSLEEISQQSVILCKNLNFYNIQYKNLGDPKTWKYDLWLWIIFENIIVLSSNYVFHIIRVVLVFFLIYKHILLGHLYVLAGLCKYYVIWIECF